MSKRRLKYIKKEIDRNSKKRKYTYGGEFPVSQLPNSMTINGNNMTSARPYNEDFTNTITTGVGIGGSLISTAAEKSNGSVDSGAMVGGELLKGAALGAGLGSAIGPWGTAIGAAAGAIGGGIYGAVESDRRNTEIKTQEELQSKRAKDRVTSYTNSVMSNYNTAGKVGSNYFQKYGGKINSTITPPVLNSGGKLEQTSSNTSTADGNTHEQGGIKLENAEIETNEVLKDDGNSVNVFSDKSFYKGGITHAEAADKISRKKGKLEKLANSRSIYAKNSAERTIKLLDDKLDEIFSHQESQKSGTENNEKFAYGGSYRKSYASTIERALPYIDNATNAILTNKTPNIPNPVVDRALPLKTDFNINPQLIEQKNSLDNTTKELNRNTSNSNDFRNNAIAASLSTTNNVNKLYGQKENIETNLINNDRMNTQQVNSSNIAKENQFNINKMNRVDDIHGRISANASNASVDAQMQTAQQNMYERDNAELELLKRKYQETGIWDRNVEDVFTEYRNGSITKEDFELAVNDLGGNIAKLFKESKGKNPNKKMTRKEKRAELQNMRTQIKEGTNQIVPFDKDFNEVYQSDGSVNPFMDYNLSKRYGIYHG